jgi:hypothetical protein
MYKDKFCSCDNLISISFDDIITTVVSNEEVINEDTIKRVFRQLTNEALLNAKEDLLKHTKDILKVCNNNR